MDEQRFDALTWLRKEFPTWYTANEQELVIVATRAYAAGLKAATDAGLRDALKALDEAGSGLRESILRFSQSRHDCKILTWDSGKDVELLAKVIRIADTELNVNAGDLANHILEHLSLAVPATKQLTKEQLHNALLAYGFLPSTNGHEKLLLEELNAILMEKP